MPLFWEPFSAFAKYKSPISPTVYALIIPCLNIEIKRSERQLDVLLEECMIDVRRGQQ